MKKYQWAWIMFINKLFHKLGISDKEDIDKTEADIIYLLSYGLSTSESIELYKNVENRFKSVLNTKSKINTSNVNLKIDEIADLKSENLTITNFLNNE
jgi:hypothetical protein